MKREIKFKAKIVMDIEPLAMKKGDWVEGHYYEDLQDGEWCSWIQECNDIIHYKVDKNTLGQFTGLLDKNEKEIWEYDIVDWGGAKLIVKFIDGRFFICKNYKYDLFSERGEISVIGNIFDNPELLEGGAE